mmetsp:Transcript_29740/g.64054  ORF Transcript_29740/g.64054 Transcript_29740/m.64054 type:complete len:391 (+) Transcript_29740:101-1273(+)
MMQPSLPPPSSSRDVNGNNGDGNNNDNDKPPCSSIFDAIKEGDWEGLLTLYATTAYDAVHSAEFARQGGSSGSGNTNIDSSFHRQHNSPPFFRDEKKMEGAASFQGYNSESNNNNKNKASSVNLPSSSSVIRELDAVVREIIGAELFDEHHNNNGNDESDNNDIVLHKHKTTTLSSSTKSTSTSHSSNADSYGTHQLQGHTTNQHSNKKTRLHQHQHSSSSSPSTRKSPPGGGSSSSLDHILSHGHHHHHHHHSTHNHRSTTHQYLSSSSSTSPSSPPSTPTTGRAAAARRRSSNSSKGERNTTKNTTATNTMDWEKIMWNSAATLSNTRPTPSFVVHLSDRDRREMEDGVRGANGSNNGTDDGVNRALYESPNDAVGNAKKEEEEEEGE